MTTDIEGSRLGAAQQILSPPPRWLIPCESRALVEALLTILATPLLRDAARGDGHPVLVLPGFLAGDATTALLRWHLSRLGFRPHRWELGRNLGGVARIASKLRARLAEIHRRDGRKVSVVGWSLGGFYARLLGAEMPEVVRYVISLGSPCVSLRANNVTQLYPFISGERLEEIPREYVESVAGDLAMPAMSIYSRSDAVVAWRSSLIATNHHAENVEVSLASHAGLGMNPAVLWAVADRLAQAEGHFTPFRRAGPFRIAYPPGTAGSET